MAKEKRAKYKKSPAEKKEVRGFSSLQDGKRARFSQDVDTIHAKMIGWNFHRMDDGGPWPCNFRKLTQYRDLMLAYEGQTIEQILQKRHCHPTGCDVVCVRAQNRLALLDIGGDIFQLDIGGSARLWGILQHNIFHLLWIDPNHEVYNSRQ